MDFVQGQPDTRLLQGVNAGGWLWGGGQYIMSRDAVDYIVRNGEQWDHSVMEDVAVSNLAKVKGIPLNYGCASCSINMVQPSGYLTIQYIGGGQTGFHFEDFSEFKSKNKCHFIRVKQDGDRTKDAFIMRELHKNNV
jgi:hypothetical protein